MLLTTISFVVGFIIAKVHSAGFLDGPVNWAHLQLKMKFPKVFK